MSNIWNQYVVVIPAFRVEGWSIFRELVEASECEILK